MGFFAHAQTVDTRPFFPLPTWPGYEARWLDDCNMHACCLGPPLTSVINMQSCTPVWFSYVLYLMHMDLINDAVYQEGSMGIIK